MLSPVVPAEGGHGLAMRAGLFLNAYARMFEIDLAVFPLIAAPILVTDFVKMRVARVEIFDRLPLDSHFQLVAAIVDPDQRLAAFRAFGRPSLTGRLGAAAQDRLGHWLGPARYDVVHVERLYLAPLAQRWLLPDPASRPRLMIDCDDDDAATYQRVAAIERRSQRPRAAAWAETEAAAFAKMARQVLPRFDRAFVASSKDIASMSQHAPSVALVPNVAPRGVTAVPRNPRRRDRTILFTGTMGYLPNDEAVRWLVSRIWPRLCKAVRGPLRLLIVGRDPAADLVRLARGQGVRVIGAVPDLAPYYRAADLAVIPLRAGGGTRIKLLEAAAYGVPIVSTTIGAEGTTFRHRHDLLLADTENGFVRACAEMLTDDKRAADLSRRARARVRRDYDRDRWSRRISDWAACGLVTRINDAATHARP